MTNNNNIADPNLRDEIETAIKDFGDLEMQIAHWSSSDGNNYWHCVKQYVLDSVLHAVCLDAQNYIGKVWYDNAEALVIRDITLMTETLVNEIGDNHPDETYINNSKWLELIEQAARIYAIIHKNSQNNQFVHSFGEANKLPSIKLTTENFSAG